SRVWVRCSAERSHSANGRRNDSRRTTTPHNRRGGTSASVRSSSNRTRKSRSTAHPRETGGSVARSCTETTWAQETRGHSRIKIHVVKSRKQQVGRGERFWLLESIASFHGVDFMPTALRK